MKDGFYDKVETELQGQNNTYYVGGLMAFELTERNSSYAMAMVRKNFGCADPLPRFPYVKVPTLPTFKCHWIRILNCHILTSQIYIFVEIVATKVRVAGQDTSKARRVERSGFS